MIRRLIEADFEERASNATEEQVSFWLLESRTPEMLLALNAHNPNAVEKAVRQRHLLSILPAGITSDIEQSLHEEELAERKADRLYWAPLRKELEQLRHQK
jgi:hypothetical protein